MKKQLIVIVGADGGLGAALMARCHGLGLTETIGISGPFPPLDNIQAHDFRYSEDVYQAAELIRERTSNLISSGTLSPEYYPVLINCVGVNYIEWFPQADLEEQFNRLMRINVLSHLQLVQELIGSKPPLTSVAGQYNNWFRDTGTLIEIISNASHMPMTNSVIYNATKGAQHIATLALGRELKKTHNLTVFGISPNKLKGTGMSTYIEGRVPELRGWTPEQAEAYQLASLAAGEETTPEALAGFIANLVRTPDDHKFLANTVIPYGA
jgi:NAD(P)-dependent dehydrogenase (short-subunit alcohol dehydrogenase family)